MLALKTTCFDLKSILIVNKATCLDVNINFRKIVVYSFFELLAVSGVSEVSGVSKMIFDKIEGGYLSQFRSLSLGILKDTKYEVCFEAT